MSLLDELIEKMCPEGVEFKRFDEVCTLNARIGWQRLTRAEYLQQGDYMLVTGTDFTERNKINYETCVYVTEDRYNQDKKIQLSNGDVLITKDGTIGKVAQVIDLPMPATLNGGVFVVRCKDGSLENRFIMHYLLSGHFQKVVKQQKTGSTISHVTQELFSRIRIPVPPKKIQQQIIRILDEFSQITTKIQEKLQEEIQLRKSQYNYFLNGFFETQTENIVPLKSLGTLTRGKRFVHADATEDGVPCVHYGELYTYYGVHASQVKSHIREELRSKMRYAQTGDVIIVGAGENNIDIGIGVAWEGDEDVAVHDACYTLKHKQIPKYISYYLRSDMYHYQIKKYVSEGKICSISADGIGKALIPIPSHEEQLRIVGILEKYDEVTKRICESLPTEIDMRKKEFEFYRDKLLLFKEREVQ